MQISHSISYPSFKEGMNARSLLTGNEVKAFFVIPAWFHLTGQQVQSYRLPVRLKDRDREIDTDTHTHTHAYIRIPTSYCLHQEYYAKRTTNRYSLESKSVALWAM